MRSSRQPRRRGPSRPRRRWRSRSPLRSLRSSDGRGCRSTSEPWAGIDHRGRPRARQSTPRQDGAADRPPRTGRSAMVSPGELENSQTLRLGRFAHARERQSRCVTTAGPGRRARSAVSHTSLGMVAVRENPAWCGRLRVGVAHWRQGRRKAGDAVYPRRHRTGRSAARPDADRRQELLRPRLRGRPQPGCPPHLLRPARQGEPARPGAQFFRPLRQTIESVNDTSKASSTWNATAGTPQPG